LQARFHPDQLEEIRRGTPAGDDVGRQAIDQLRLLLQASSGVWPDSTSPSSRMEFRSRFRLVR
jgi:hypothetical protein